MLLSWFIEDGNNIGYVCLSLTVYSACIIYLVFFDGKMSKVFDKNEADKYLNS